MKIKNEFQICLCGCGLPVLRANNKYINNHNIKKLGLSNRGKLTTDETKNKMSLSQKKVVHTTEWNNKVSKKLKGRIITWNDKMSMARKGKKDSEETKTIKSSSRKKYIEENGLGSVFEGKNEKFILDCIASRCNIELLRNNQNISKKIKGKSIDGYSSKYNLSIEILEEHHFDKLTHELIQCDLDRQVQISERLCCMIYYIPEQEFLKNPEKEIQRFKDFLLLLDQNKN